MATKSSRKAKNSAEKKAESESSATKDLLTRVRERAAIMIEADRENRTKALEDIRFVNVPGSQWDDAMKKDRGDRPCYEFNRLRVSCKRVINDMKANRSTVKVRGTEDSDKEKAEIREGIIRNIWTSSDADSVVDYQAEYQVGAGMGAWRVNTKYLSDASFDQDIVIEGFENPFSVYCDPAAKDPMKRDAEDWLVLDRISKSSYERRWPDREVVNWDSTEFDDAEEWTDKETVRVVEYWYKEQYDAELWLLADGRVIDSAQPGANQIDAALIKRKRMMKRAKIRMCLASGDSILEQSEWAGSMFPFVMAFGEYINIEGKRHWCGLPRYSKDAQRAFNVATTSVVEKAAAAPNAKWWATADQAKGHTLAWAEAHKKNYPFMVFNPDPKMPGPPVSMSSDPVPAALLQVSMLTGEEIKSTNGIFDPSLGRETPDKSGRALIEQRQQGEIATFNFQDNIKKGIQRTGEILLDLIPKVIDTERQLRILGPDGAEKYVKVNQIVIDPRTAEQVTLNDLSEGRFDVTSTTGPSFATKRQEASELYSQMAKADPLLMPTSADLVYQSMDLPYSDQIAERRRAMLPPPIQKILTQGKKIPPEAAAVLAQAEQAMQQVQEQAAQVQAAAVEAQAGKAEADKSKSELQKLVSDLAVKQAQFDATTARQVAEITKKEAALLVKEASVEAAAQSATAASAQGQARQTFEQDVTAAIAQIQAAAQEFTELAGHVLVAVNQRAAQPAQPQAPKKRRIRIKRVNGEMVGTVDEMDDGGNVTSSRSVSARRINGELVGEG